ncbi:MAG: hypothetical protein M0P31_06525 [Solirubrobacteraceae bacterium]|nr:hypothetical protein [Solirubrobacteraceae bacterium]
MSRSLIVVATATLALAVPAASLAATPRTGTFKARKGQIVRGYDLKFTVDRGGKRIKGVVAHVLESCGGSSTSQIATVGPDLTWKVRSGKFSGRKKEKADGVTVYTTLKGRFTSPTTARGVIRQETIVAGYVCDTYELKFTAKRR